jgi:hypothetical protein
MPKAVGNMPFRILFRSDINEEIKAAKILQAASNKVMKSISWTSGFETAPSVSYYKKKRKE